MFMSRTLWITYVEKILFTFLLVERYVGFDGMDDGVYRREKYIILMKDFLACLLLCCA